MRPLSQLLGPFFRPPEEFNGTASEERTYRRAVNLWREAGYRTRGDKFIRPTLGATVERGRFRLIGRSTTRGGY